jgi:heme-degrading monooxygenase HmoA
MTTFKALLLVGLAIISIGAHADSTYLCQSDGARLHQLRIYEVNPANRDHFHRRFQEHALPIMRRHGFDIVDMWESETDTKLQFVYVLAWPDEATMDRRWKSFLADPEWIEIKRRSSAEHGELVREANGQPLVRVSYSPACKD